MLADKVDDDRIKPLSVIDISVTRNGYGRQVHSFYANIKANLNGNNITLNSAFIRAPIVLDYGSNVKVYSVYNDRPILLSENKCLVSSFHTELDYDLSLIKFFLDKFVLNV